MLLYNAPKLDTSNVKSFQELGGSPTAGDVAGAQIDTFMYENLHDSREQNINEEVWSEIVKVRKLAPEIFGPASVPQTNPNAPKILQEAWNETAQGTDASRASDWEGYIEPQVEELKKRFPDANIRNRDEIDADIAAQAKVYRDTFNKIYERADTFESFFGVLGGGVVGAMNDSINIMTLPLGATRVATGSFLRSLATVVGRNFAIGVGIEAAIQPFVYDYKKEIESPYDLYDAVFAMGAAGAGMGLLNGLGHSIGRGWAKYRGKVFDEMPDSYEKRRALKDLNEAFETLQRAQNFSDQTGAKTVAELEIHLKALTQAIIDVKSGKPIDFEALAGSVDRQLMENLELEFKAAGSKVDAINKVRDRLMGKLDDDGLTVQTTDGNTLVLLDGEVVGSFKLSEGKGTLRINDSDLNYEGGRTTGLSASNTLESYLAIAKANPGKKIISGNLTEQSSEIWKALFKDGRATRSVDKSNGGFKYEMTPEARKYLNDVEASELDSLNFQLEDFTARLNDINLERLERLELKEQDTNAAQMFAPDGEAITSSARALEIEQQVNNILAQLGAIDIKVKIHEGNPEFGPDMRLSREGDVDVSADSVLQFTPFKIAQDIAVAYAKSKGINYTPPTKHVVANPERGRLIAEEFARMKHEPGNKEVAAAYDAMINETTDQFKFILGSGLKIEFIRGDDPYVNGPSDVINDIKNNNHIWVYSTRDGFGSNEKFDPVDNPLLKETEFEIDGVKLLANDVFRIVHDYFGHVQTGTTFRATGEENAWQSHAAMYTPLARRAMTTETRGQNSWVNYGPDGTINRTATTGNTTFADQKIGLLPRWVSEENRVSASDRKIRYESDRRNNQTGFEGAVDEQGRVQLIHYSRELISRTDPDRWGNGLSRNVRSEQNRRLSGAPGRTYFGIEQATENGYKKELGLGDYRLETTIDGELIYNPAKNPDGLWDSMDIVSSERAIANAGYVGYYVNSKQLGKVVAVFDEIEVAPAVPTNMRFSLADGGVSTRMPGGVKATEDGLKTDLLVGAETDLADPVTLAKNTAKIELYDGYVPQGIDETPEQVATNFIAQLKDNLLWLHDQVPAKTRERSKKWYDGANKITTMFAIRYGLTKEQSAGVLAALSPQKDWFMNASLGERVMDIFTNHQNTAWSPEMEFVATDPTLVGPKNKKYPAGILVRKEANIKLYEAIQGKQLNELSDNNEIAAWIRTFDEAHNDRSHRVVTPEGKFTEKVLTEKGKDAVTGWGSFSEIGKAVGIIRDGSAKNTSDQLGNYHKVRNFFNNILLPNSVNGHVTIDTHAVAADMLGPFSGKSTEVEHNFGTKASSSKTTGSKGTYGLHAEAYRQAAAERGILPRQMQSITWEAARGLFPKPWKTAENVQLIRDIWKRHKAGKITLDETRQEILNAAGGINEPAWVRSSGGLADQEWVSSYKGDIPGNGLPRNRGLDSASGRGVGDDAARTPTDPDGGVRYSKDGQTIEAAIDPTTGELHINASAFRNEAHLMAVLREEVIGHYGLRKSLGNDFQGVIDDIKSSATTNPELRQMWIDLSGVDPQTKTVVNTSAPYRGMADDVIADEIISKMAREEISDTTWLALKNIIIKALRKIGLIKEDITISEMKALVVRSEAALKKNLDNARQATITRTPDARPAANPATPVTPETLATPLKNSDDDMSVEGVNAEVARILNDESIPDGLVFDSNGNSINIRDALMEVDNELAGIESIRVCML